MKYQLISHYAGEQVICGESDDLAQLANQGWEYFKKSPIPGPSYFGGHKEYVRFSIETAPCKDIIGEVSVARLGWHLVEGLAVPFSTGAFPSVSYKHELQPADGCLHPKQEVIDGALVCSICLATLIP